MARPFFMYAAPHRPEPPKEEYYTKVERKYIYQCSESLREDDDWDDEDEDEDTPKLPQKPITEVDLGWLLQQVPEGVTPSQIKIEFGYNASSMSYDDHYVNFYYEIVGKLDKKSYNQALKFYEEDMKRYEKEIKQYEKDKAEGEAKAKAEEIKELEEKLKELKGK